MAGTFTRSSGEKITAAARHTERVGVKVLGVVDLLKSEKVEIRHKLLEMEGDNDRNNEIYI